MSTRAHERRALQFDKPPIGFNGAAVKHSDIRSLCRFWSGQRRPTKSREHLEAGARGSSAAVPECVCVCVGRRSLISFHLFEAPRRPSWTNQLLPWPAPAAGRRPRSLKRGQQGRRKRLTRLGRAAIQSPDCLAALRRASRARASSRGQPLVRGVGGGGRGGRTAATGRSLSSVNLARPPSAHWPRRQWRRGRVKSHATEWRPAEASWRPPIEPEQRQLRTSDASGRQKAGWGAQKLAAMRAGDTQAGAHALPHAPTCAAGPLIDGQISPEARQSAAPASE